MLHALLKKYRIYRLKRKGLQIAGDCRLIGMPDWGSEPYLISIGNHVTIAGRVTFINHDGGTWIFRDEVKYKNVIKYGRITIRDNCFIGYGVTILPGVEIGPNSVVGAGAIVAQTIPPDSVAVGTPARVIMSRSEYAERSLAQTPEYDGRAYAVDKRRELLRLFPNPW